METSTEVKEDKGYNVVLYFNKEGEFVASVNGVETKLNPWVGVQMDQWNKIPCDWTRKNFAVYEPNSLATHLQKEQK